jgi:hypothetical protein
MTHRHVAGLLIAGSLICLWVPFGLWPAVILAGTGGLLIVLGRLKPPTGPYGD